MRPDDELRAQDYFPDVDASELFDSSKAWPPLDGVLIILFTSRSGSTYLSEEIERRYATGKIRESFNLPNLRNRSRRHGSDSPAVILRRTIRRFRGKGWFAAKAGRPGLVIAEQSGFFDRYIDRTSFILLLRRDIVAQAVSVQKAHITARYHSRRSEETPAKESDYSYENIKHSMEVISRGVARLIAFAREAGQPLRTLVYEQFAAGEFGAVEKICDEFGIPRRTSAKFKPRQIEKIGNELNIRWCARFRAEMDDEASRLVENHEKLARTMIAG